ncbi:glycosyltransferase family 2 protein [Candidatus Pacearchaeota archaeon]|nr:glycosyltransferase family 2 protein [Candidatus Pacearchaeota archaeon]
MGKVTLTPYTQGKIHKITAVIMTWNRNHRNSVSYFLQTLIKDQNIKPLEVVVVDTSNDAQTTDIVKYECEKYGDLVKYYYFKKDKPLKAWALNVGMRLASPDTEYFLTSDIDMIWPSWYLDMAHNYIDENSFILTEPSKLPEKFNYNDLIRRGSYWKDLYKQSVPWGKAGGPGNGQLFSKEFIFEVQGYNEIFSDGQDAYDMEMWRRAKKHSLKVRWWGRRWNQSLHLWHPISEYKGRNQRFVNLDPPVVANSGGWGEYP